MNLVGMLELQTIDTGIDQAVHARDRLSALLEMRAAESEVASWRERRQQIESRQAEAQSELDRIEAESTDIGTTRDRLERQLKTILAPREAEAIQHEMQILAARRNGLDDRGIELLEASSAADEELAEIDAAISRATEVVAAARERATRAEEEADRDLAARRAERDVASASLDPTSLADYERRRISFGGVAMATIAHGSCTACHMELSVAETDAIKRLPEDAVPECPHCARILVR